MSQNTLKNKIKENMNSDKLNPRPDFKLNLDKRIQNQIDYINNRNDSSQNGTNNAIPKKSLWIYFQNIAIATLIIVSVFGAFSFFTQTNSPEVKTPETLEKKTKKLVESQISQLEKKNVIHYSKSETIEYDSEGPAKGIVKEVWTDEETGNSRKVETEENQKIITVENELGVWRYSEFEKSLNITKYTKPSTEKLQFIGIDGLLKSILSSEKLKFEEKGSNTITIDWEIGREVNRYFFDSRSERFTGLENYIKQSDGQLILRYKVNYVQINTIERTEENIKKYLYFNDQIASNIKVNTETTEGPGAVTKLPDVTITTTPVPTTTVAPTSIPVPSLKTVKVYYFSGTQFNIPGNTNYLLAKERKSSRTDIATFALEEMIKGPSEAEINGSDKLVNIVKLEGVSTCFGRDFTLSINNKVATLRFCKTIVKENDVYPIAFAQMIQNTLNQFPTITSVRIYEANGNCYNDTMSDINYCK